MVNEKKKFYEKNKSTIKSKELRKRLEKSEVHAMSVAFVIYALGVIK